ncbi:hypothetical protein SAY86_004422 [Trapa natans]|uniref:Uncharacterized protein n=1 Tax=Trapa natans TaxID=22666 RepID=A0AAN7RIV0_TRANT|nr:hypothetical protein SAY86_004422 [Trapa natans]
MAPSMSMSRMSTLQQPRLLFYSPDDDLFRTPRLSSHGLLLQLRLPSSSTSSSSSRWQRRPSPPPGAADLDHNLHLHGAVEAAGHGLAIRCVGAQRGAVGASCCDTRGRALHLGHGHQAEALRQRKGPLLQVLERPVLRLLITLVR